MKKRNWKNKAMAAALALVGCMSITGISAYFTDGQAVTNTFTIGSISLELMEPGWVAANGQNVVPEQEIRKDPQIKNDGVNDEYVFLEVVLPYANIQTANDNGTWNPAADVELFSYDVNTADWVQVGNAVKNAADKTVTYVYAYAKQDTMTALKAGVTTPPLFEYVRLANVAEDQGLEGASVEILINAYGIQTTNLNDGDTTVDGVNSDGKTTPADVWAVVNAKRPAL